MMDFFGIFLAIPIISGLIGWGTNYLAVKMIFRPREPRRFLGLTLWGLIPKRKQELAQSVGQTVASHLFSVEDILTHLSPEELADRFKPVVERIIDDLLQQKLGQIPMVSMFLQGELLAQVRALLVNDVVAFTPEFVAELAQALEGKLKIEEVVRKKIEDFDVMRLEEIIFQIASRELKAIEILGGVIGVVVGLVQVGLVSLLG
jgi:uncharacterized membrane protein YheB (UPF0754 family)